MKPVGALLLLFVVLGSGGRADEPAAPRKPFPTKDVPKDMKPYFIVLLVAGPKYQPGDPPEHKALLPKHLAHIRKLIEAKKLRFAGPTMDEGRVMGVGVVAAPNIEQAKAWMDEDPAPRALGGRRLMGAGGREARQFTAAVKTSSIVRLVRHPVAGTVFRRESVQMGCATPPNEATPS